MSSVIALVELASVSSHPTRDGISERTIRETASIRSNASVDARENELLGPLPEGFEDTATKLRGGKALIVSLQFSLFMAATSFTTGLLTIGIVEIAADLNLDPSLVYWPVLAYNLTSSPLLIPFGALADIFGARFVNLLGCLTSGLFVVACGLARTGSELIAFRCLHGVAGAMFLPTSMSITSTTLASGRVRNVALASLGLSMVVGYGLGLVLGGILLDSVGWRLGYYVFGGLQLALFIIGLRVVPSMPTSGSDRSKTDMVRKLRTQMDWIGALISCTCIGMLSYVLAMISEDLNSIQQPLNYTLLIISILLIPGFIFWMRNQERHGKPALMPSSLWKTTFITICIIVTFANAEMQCMEVMVSLFFQNVQSFSPLQTSLRLIPGLVTAASINIVTGSIVHKLKISWTLAVASLLAGVSPLLMAIINPMLPYWYEAFPAQVLYPLCIDFVFVVSAIIIADSFPVRDQALAGAVFNTIGNLGQGLGLALIAIITNSVTVAYESGSQVKTPQGLLAGYRAGFWVAFGSMLLTAAIGAWGLRQAGAVGMKRD